MTSTASTRNQVGPTTQEYTIHGRDDEVVVLRGRLLGFATSKRDTHYHPVTYDAQGALTSFPAHGERCSACRWFEVRIFEVFAEYLPNGAETSRRGRYLVLTSGASIVPGEVRMSRSIWTDSPYEIIEVLVQRRGDHPFLPTPSARVLSQAAAWDDGIRDAYIDRAVV